MFQSIYKPLRVFIKKFRAPRIINEHPKNAWPEKYINIKNNAVLDLGCGFFGKIHLFPKVEIEGKKYTDMISTSEYFLSLGAKKIIGYDLNNEDVECLNKKSEKISARVKVLNSPKQFEEIILNENIDVIKSDIEGAEVHLLHMDDNVFKLVREYYVETHDSLAFEAFMKKFKKLHYGIRHIMRQEQGGEASIIFAYREHWV